MSRAHFTVRVTVEPTQNTAWSESVPERLVLSVGIPAKSMDEAIARFHELAKKGKITFPEDGLDLPPRTHL